METAAPGEEAVKAENIVRAELREEKTANRVLPPQEQKAKELYNTFVNLYYKLYRPPKWVQDYFISILRKYGEYTRVYYELYGFEISELDRHIKYLTNQREPVVIGERRENLISTDAPVRYYNRKELNENFGYVDAYYNSIADTFYKKGNNLPPQIAVSCRTEFRYPASEYNGGNTNQGWVYDKDKPILTLNIVNLIGLAFDSIEQTDYKYFDRKGWIHKNNEGTPQNITYSGGNAHIFIFKFMVQAYYFAFHAANDNECKYFYISPIGDGAFRPPGYDDAETFRQEFFYPTVTLAFDMYMSNVVDNKIKEIKYAIFDKKEPDSINSFNLPYCFYNKSSNWYYTKLGNNNSTDLTDCMFVNAWDPVSALGNGNYGDKSADGYWGRSTAISALGWPKSNFKITNSSYIKPLNGSVKNKIKYIRTYIINYNNELSSTIYMNNVLTQKR